MKKEPILSVIIPAYNCAPVITRCLDSIDYSDCEIIVVNDGSKDDSVKVVEQYITTHPNVRLVNKENGGASSARNLGLEHTRGKYVAFIDADDFWFQGGINRIVDLAEQTDADIVKYIITHVENGKPIPERNLTNVEMQTEIIEGKGKALEQYDISDYHVVDAVFKRSVIINNKIRFQTDLHLHEDDVFMGMFYCHASKVVITDLPLYCYIRSSDFSSTHHQSLERQRILINSGYLAAQHRSEYVQQHYPQAMPLERLKYMRWVRTPKDAIKAELTLDEYKAVLEQFHTVGVYPLCYKYINVSFWWASPKKKLKLAIKTFLINHPSFVFGINSVLNISLKIPRKKKRGSCI